MSFHVIRREEELVLSPFHPLWIWLLKLSFQQHFLWFHILHGLAACLLENIEVVKVFVQRTTVQQFCPSIASSMPTQGHNIGGIPVFSRHSQSNLCPGWNVGILCDIYWRSSWRIVRKELWLVVCGFYFPGSCSVKLFDQCQQLLESVGGFNKLARQSPPMGPETTTPPSSASPPAKDPSTGSNGSLSNTPGSLTNASSTSSSPGPIGTSPPPNGTTNTIGSSGYLNTLHNLGSLSGSATLPRALSGSNSSCNSNSSSNSSNSASLKNSLTDRELSTRNSIVGIHHHGLSSPPAKTPGMATSTITTSNGPAIQHQQQLIQSYPPPGGNNNAVVSTNGSTNGLGSPIESLMNGSCNLPSSMGYLNTEPMSVPLSHKNANHASSAFEALNKMRQCNQLCDVTIKVAGVSIPGHKVVLAAVSPYFHAMFNDDLVEKSQQLITIHEIDPDAMQQLVNYSYTGEMLITEDNVQALLPASSLLQMSLVREACCKFLLRQLHPTNCLGIRNFADTHACKELQTRSHRFALQNFAEVMTTEEFLLLPLQEVEELLGSNQLNVTHEEQAFAAVMAWIRHDVDQRRDKLSTLLSKVRMPLMSRKFLMTTVDSESLIKDDQGCKDLLLEAMRYHLLPEQRAALASDRTVERKPDGVRPYIFAVGGGSLFAIHSECECYNPRTDRWVPVSPLLTRRSRCGVSSVGKLLYAVGGYDGTSDLATAECYNPRLNKWTSIAPMGTRRSCLGLCSLDGLLYAVGGYDGASCLNSVERYDPLTGIWSCCPALSQRRRYCRLASLDGCVWAAGGLDASNAIASVERLDPREGKWVSVPALSQRRSSAGLAALDGNLYCVGGTDGSACLATSEKFDPRRLRWESVASMHTRRSTHELVSVDGFLYCLGGNDGSSSLSTVEKYDPRLNKWMLLNAMLTRRSSLGGAVLDCLPMDRLITRPC